MNLTCDRPQLAPTFATSSSATSSPDSAIPTSSAFPALPALPYAAAAAADAAAAARPGPISAARPGSITAGGRAEWAWEAAAGPGPADPFRGDWQHWSNPKPMGPV